MIANARMYAPNQIVAAAWRRLFEWISNEAGVSLQAFDHPPPRPLRELWQRGDVGSALMCGFPWVTWRGPIERPVPLAAPVPSPACFADEPFYWTDIVVHADSDFGAVDDLAGARFAYTIDDSQSGYQAPRRFFAEHARNAAGRLFGATIGPLITPRRVAEAVINGAADAGPLDAWWHALLRAHEPHIAARLRVIARTPPAPIPLVVCAAAVPENEKRRLAAALEKVGDAEDVASERDVLLLRRFVRPDLRNYQLLIDRAREADALGYDRLQ